MIVKDMKKTVDICLYSAAGLIASAAIIVFFRYTFINGDALLRHRFGKPLGWITIGLMAFEIMLYFFYLAIRKGWVDERIKFQWIEAIKFFRDYHYSIGSGAVSVMALHFAVSYNPEKLLGMRFVSGYFIVFFTAAALSSAFKECSAIKRCHIALAFTAAASALIHIIL